MGAISSSIAPLATALSTSSFVARFICCADAAKSVRPSIRSGQARGGFSGSVVPDHAAATASATSSAYPELRVFSWRRQPAMSRTARSVACAALSADSCWASGNPAKWRRARCNRGGASSPIGNSPSTLHHLSRASRQSPHGVVD